MRCGRRSPNVSAARRASTGTSRFSYVTFSKATTTPPTHFMATWSPTFASPRDGDDGPRSQVTVPPSVGPRPKKPERPPRVRRAPRVGGGGGAGGGGGEPVPSPSTFF